jgi:hypothetical protein
MGTSKRKRKPRKRGPKPELLKLDVDPKHGLDRLVRPTEPKKRGQASTTK